LKRRDIQEQNHERNVEAEARRRERRDKSRDRSRKMDPENLVRDREDMLRMHRERHLDRNHGNSPEFHEERHKKYLDMNRRRADRLKNQVIEAKFSPEEENELLQPQQQLLHLQNVAIPGSATTTTTTSTTTNTNTTTVSTNI